MFPTFNDSEWRADEYTHTPSLCERGQWVCNEKRLIEAAGLGRTQELFAQVPVDSVGRGQPGAQRALIR